MFFNIQNKLVKLNMAQVDLRVHNILEHENHKLLNYQIFDFCFLQFVQLRRLYLKNLMYYFLKLS